MIISGENIHNLSVSDYLRSKIFSGELKQNDRIIELEVAKALNKSRVHVREGLKTLINEGIVTYNVNRGCSVVSLSNKEAYEIIILYGKLENMSIKWWGSGHIVNQENVIMMEELLVMMFKASESHRNIETSILFHNQIFWATEMRHLIRLWAKISSLYKLVMSDINSEDYFSTIKYEHFYDIHYKIFMAIKKQTYNKANKYIDYYYYYFIGKFVYLYNRRI